MKVTMKYNLWLNGLQKRLVLLKHTAQLILEKEEFPRHFIPLAAVAHAQTLNHHVLCVDQTRVAHHVAVTHARHHHVVDHCLHVALIAQAVHQLEHALFLHLRRRRVRQHGKWRGNAGCGALCGPEVCGRGA